MIDAIIKRESTRTYIKETFSDDDNIQINRIVKEHYNLKGPFGNLFKFSFSINKSNVEGGKKIGTYGLIRNVPAFIGGVSNNTLESIVDFGFAFENLILSLTEIGYDTCWLGGTFKRSDYQKVFPDNEIIPAISPVGHRAKKRSLPEKAIRSSAKPLNRLDNSLLFKRYDNELPFDMTVETITSQCLDLVRIGPSASNKQPWRIITSQCLDLVRIGPSASNRQPWRIYIDGNNFHFYIERSPNYPSKSLGYDIQALDIGIALNHFTHGLNNFRQNYTYTKLENMKKFTNQEYIITIQIS